MINKFKQFLTSRWGKIALAVVLIVILAVSFYLGAKNKKPALINTNPANKQEGVSPTTTINFTFDKEIDNLPWKITISPAFLYQATITDNQLTITPNEPLETNLTYSIKISYQNREENLVFSTIQVDQAVVKEGVGDPEADEDLKNYQEENYPLFAVTPKKTVNWTANYAGPLELIISYNRSVDLGLVQKEVWAWVESFGFSIDSHQYIWQAK